MSRKTNSEFKRMIYTINNDIILLGKYKGRNEKIRCRCKLCGNEWEAWPRNLLNGTGCNKCANGRRGKKTTWTTESFVKTMTLRMPNIVILGEYKNMQEKIEVECKKCQYKWSVRPDHLLDGHGCPRCGHSLKKTNDIFREQVKAVNQLVVPISEYENGRAKVKCECKICGKKWDVIPNKVLAGNGCPFCEARNRTSFPEQALYYYIKAHYLDADSRYIIDNTKMELDIYIPHICTGIEYDGERWHKNSTDKEKRKYSLCKDRGIMLYRVRENMENEPDEKIADYIFLRKKPYNYKSLDAVIIEGLTVLGIEEEVNTERDANEIRRQFYTLLRSNSLLEKYPQVAAEWNVEKNGSITPQMIAYGSNEKVWWKCQKCQNEWKAAVCDRTVGHKGCKLCKDKAAGQRRRISNEEFLKRLYKVNPDMIPLEEYKTTHEGIKTKCRICGHIWYPMPSNSLRGRKCPICRRTGKDTRHEILK